MKSLYFFKLNNMKKSVIVVLSFFCLPIFGQSPTFISQWNYTQKTILIIDSMTTSIKKQKIKFLKQKNKYYSDKEFKTSREEIIKIKQGNIVTKTYYKIKGVCKIKELKINGNQTYIESEFNINGYGPTIKNIFINIGSSTWHFNYLNVEANNSNQEMRDKYKTETIFNWPN